MQEKLENEIVHSLCYVHYTVAFMICYYVTMITHFALLKRFPSVLITCLLDA